MKKKFQAIKGVRDILPPETSLWNWFEETTRRVFESYGFREIRVPIFEETELFARSVGADTDIVNKEMYRVFDPIMLELEGLRAHLLSRTPSLNDENALIGYVCNFEYFFAMLQKGFATGEIPVSGQNDKHMAALNNQVGRWSLQETRFQPEPAEWNDYRARLRQHLPAINLGAMSLRPEATASVVRAYIEHGMHTWPGLVKLYYVGPMFRRERPQKGRYRQFYQIGAEVLGQTDHPGIDAELMEMLAVLLGECGIERWTLLVNSIGCANCRPKYVEKLRHALDGVKSQMCGDCQRRTETNPLRVLDCKVEADQPIIKNLPVITDHLDQPCREHFEEFQRQLKLRDIPYTITPRLVRGLDYYMRTTFEITSPVLGAQNALVGGGRYDGLTELLGGPPAKGFGFALGTDRFIDAIKDAGKVDASSAAGGLDVFVAWIGAAAYPAAVRLARRLRGDAFTVELPPEEMKLKKSIGVANKLHARYTLLVGEDELAAQKFTLRRMSDGEQKQLSESELLDHLKATRKV